MDLLTTPQEGVQGTSTALSGEVQGDKSLFNIKSAERAINLYYVKLGFVTCDTLIDVEYLLTQFKPNHRLLNRIANLMTGLGHKIKRDKLFFIDSRQKAISWVHPSTHHLFSPHYVVLSSRPFDGKSYIRITILNSRKSSRMTFDLLAQTPTEVYDKCLKFGLIQIKKGGSHV